MPAVRKSLKSDCYYDYVSRKLSSSECSGNSERMRSSKSPINLFAIIFQISIYYYYYLIFLSQTCADSPGRDTPRKWYDCD